VARKAAVATLGSSVLVLGTALIPLPVPGAAILVIPIGLAILATEFAWAQKLVEPLRKLLQRLKAAAARLLRRPPTGR
jgi:tellurite resistance protein TerC